MAKLANLTRSVVRTAAGFHRHHARWPTGEKRKHLLAPQPLAEYHLAGRICSVRLKHSLRQVQTDRACFRHGRLLSSGDRHHHSGTPRPSGRRPPHHGLDPLRTFASPREKAPGACNAWSGIAWERREPLFMPHFRHWPTRLEDRGDALADADAHRHQRVVAAGAPQLTPLSRAFRHPSLHARPHGICAGSRPDRRLAWGTPSQAPPSCPP